MTNKLFICIFVLAIPVSFAQNKPAANTIVTEDKKCTPSGAIPPLAGRGYSDPKFCCTGNIIVISKEACDKPYKGFAGLCAPCGNGKCDSQWEDNCNCPEDCPATPKAAPKVAPKLAPKATPKK